MAEENDSVLHRIPFSGKFSDIANWLNENFRLIELAIKQNTGKSAYEVWRDYTDGQGNQPNIDKTEEEFLASLKESGYKMQAVTVRPSTIAGIDADTIYLYPDGTGQFSTAIYTGDLNSTYDSTKWVVLATNPGDLSGAFTDISGLRTDVNNLSALVGYFTCDTAAATDAKTVQATGYALTNGGNIRIKMTHANTAESPITLQIGSAAAKELYYNNEPVSSDNTWGDNEVITVYYDGTKYIATNSLGGGGSEVDDKGLLMLKREEIDLPSQSGYNVGYLITKTNTLRESSGGIAVQNIGIQDTWDSCIIKGTTTSNYGHCLIDANEGVIATFNDATKLEIEIVFSDYPTAKYLSISATGNLLRMYVIYRQSETIQEYASFNKDVAFVNGLSSELFFPPKFSKGGFYTDKGELRSYEGSVYTEVPFLIPAGATKAYYTGYSAGSGAKGAIIWLDNKQKIISVYSPNSSNAQAVETTIPAGAVYFLASSYNSICDVTFDTDSKSIDDVINQPEIRERMGSAEERIDSLEQSGGGFAKQKITVQYPTVINTKYKLTTSLSLFFDALDNTEDIHPSEVRFYTDTAKSSINIYIGSIDEQAKTYRIDDVVEISGNFEIGENSVDISSYNITIPPQSIVACSGATGSVDTNLTPGVRFVARFSNVSEGSTGQYSDSNIFSGYTPQFCLIEQKSIGEDGVFNALKSNILFAKKYTALGDSFTAINGITTTIADEGKYKGVPQVYPYVIGNRNYMEVQNLGSSGSTLVQFIMRGWYNHIPIDVDYVTIWYGINDNAHQLSIGTVDDDDVDIPNISAESEATTCSAFNWMLRWLITNRPLAHIGVIISDFIPSKTIDGVRKDLRREAIMACCEKWGVAYLDLYDPTVPMIRSRGSARKYEHNTSIAPNGYVTVCEEAKTLRMNVFSTNTATEDMHPNATCHLWQSNLVENFMRGL